MIAPKQIADTENFAFKACLVFKILSRNFLFLNRKVNRNY